MKYFYVKYASIKSVLSSKHHVLLAKKCQFKCGQIINLAGHLIVLLILRVGQNVLYVLCLVGPFSILIGHCPFFFLNTLTHCPLC